MSSDPIPPETVEEIINQSNSGLDGSLCRILTLPSTVPQSCAISSDPIPPFPVEIFEHIIDQSNDRDGSLCRLSLTCHAFLPRARLNLFFRIHIGHKEKLESAPAFLEARPWLPLLVRCLTIRDYPMRYPFMLLAVVPSRLIGMLPHLRSLKFDMDRRGIGPRLNSLRYMLAYSRFMLSILHKSWTPIQHLELAYLEFRTPPDFVQLLCALPHLKSLICRHTKFFRSGGDTASLVKNKTLYLTHLATDQVFDPIALELLLDMGQATLESVRMSICQFLRPENEGDTAFDHSPMEPPSIPILSRLRHLRTLTLAVTECRELELATQILSEIPSTGALRCLNIVYGPELLTSLAFNTINPSHRHLFQTFEKSIFRLPLREVVFSPAHCRKNRRGLWSSALDQAFLALKQRTGRILKITDRPPPGLFNQRSLWTATSETGVIGHDYCVSSLVVSPNGSFFASSSSDSTIILWDAHQGTVVHEWVGHSGHDGVRCLAFSPDSQYLLSGGDEGTAKVWDILDGPVEQVQVLEVVGGIEDNEDTTGTYNQCAWSADGMWLSASFEEIPGKHYQVHLWDAHTFCLRFVFKGPLTDNCCPASFSPDSRWLMWPSISTDDNNDEEYLYLWDGLAPDAPPRTFSTHHDNSGLPRALSFDPTSKYLVTTYDFHLRVWDIVTGAPLALMEGHTDYIYSTVFSPDGQYILSASLDGMSKVWLAESGECTLSLKGHKEGVNQALFSPDGNYIATASDDMTVRLWRARDGSCLGTFTDHGHYVRHVVFSPDGQVLASGDGEGIVLIRDISHIIGQ